jgi:ABC-type sugar transport system substrate-binding protein
LAKINLVEFGGSVDVDQGTADLSDGANSNVEVESVIMGSVIMDSVIMDSSLMVGLVVVVVKAADFFGHRYRVQGIRGVLDE